MSNKYLFFWLLLFLLDIKYHEVKASLIFTLQLRMTMNSWSSHLHFLNSGITNVLLYPALEAESKNFEKAWFTSHSTYCNSLPYFWTVKRKCMNSLGWEKMNRSNMDRLREKRHERECWLSIIFPIQWKLWATPVPAGASRRWENLWETRRERRWINLCSVIQILKLLVTTS